MKAPLTLTKKITLTFALMLGLQFVSLTALSEDAEGKKRSRRSDQAQTEKKKVKRLPQINLTYGDDACATTESWNFSHRIDPQWRILFEKFLDKSISNVQGFSEALAMRKLGDSAEARLFAEYWVSRSLLKSGMYHSAYHGFTALAGKEVDKESAGIYAAALDCLTAIQYRYPTLDFDEKVGQRINDFHALLEEDAVLKRALLPAVWRTAAAYLTQQIAEDAARSKIQKTLETLKGSKALESYGRGMIAAKYDDPKSVVKNLDRYLTGPIPKILAKNTDSVRIILAHARYRLKDYKGAVEQLKRVEKGSNRISQALSELAWAYLMDEDYKSAVGTSINLQTGGLRSTFAPEAPMVMAMALNEMCQYPKAAGAVNVFRNYYKNPYIWLNNWHQKDRKQKDFSLYKLALSYLKRENLVPERVASEWVRSPVFIANQDEINLLFQEKKTAVRVGKEGAEEQRNMAKQLLAFTLEVKKRYQMAKINLKPGEDLPQSLYTMLDQLKFRLATYRRLQSAAPVWLRILKFDQSRSGGRIDSLVANINHDLQRMSSRMYRQLGEVAENNYFIEVEIYNGAAKDIIWKNSYPDYEQVAEDLKSQGRSTASTSWNWGTVSTSMEGENEIWEDELGSFQADLYNNCSSKEEYLAIKREKAIEKAREAMADAGK